MHRALSGPTVMLVVAAALAATSAWAERFEITAGDERTIVEFESRAPLESFTGRTQSASGFIVCAPAAIGDSITVHVDVDMASLDTGIGKRNADMRENHLETDRYPTATFRGASLIGDTPRALLAGEQIDVRMAGQLTLHGITRRIEVVVAFTYESDADGASLHATTRFPVVLPDYGISRPKFLFLKLGEEQWVTIDILARATTDAGASHQPDGED